MPYHDFLCEDTYKERMRDEVRPFLLARKTESVFHTDGGTALYTVRYTADNPRGSVVIVHGLAESAEKYHEMIYYFLQSGLSVLTYDQRGHGRSTRTVEKGVIYVKRFSHYVDDLAALLGHEEAHLPRPRFLFGHSMGGGVSALFLEKHAGFFDKAVLSSPMISAQLGKIPRFFGFAFCGLFTLLGQGKHRVFLLSEAKLPEKEAFETSSATSPARFFDYQETKKGNPLFYSAKPSYGWTLTALACTRHIMKRGAPEGISIPVLLFSAKHEHLVRNDVQQRFISRVPNGTLAPEMDTKHEIYAASDGVFHDYMTSILTFFDALT